MGTAYQVLLQNGAPLWVERWVRVVSPPRLRAAQCSSSKMGSDATLAFSPREIVARIRVRRQNEPSSQGKLEARDKTQHEALLTRTRRAPALLAALLRPPPLCSSSADSRLTGVRQASAGRLSAPARTTRRAESPFSSACKRYQMPHRAGWAASHEGCLFRILAGRRCSLRVGEQSGG